MATCDAVSYNSANARPKPCAAPCRPSLSSPLARLSFAAPHLNDPLLNRFGGATTNAAKCTGRTAS
eukprot:9748001-Alexandrium_andersonii.AAC.1